MSDTIKQKFWDRLDDTRSGMLSSTGAPAVPMSHYVEDDAAPVIWFITAKGTDLGKAAMTGADAQYIVMSSDEGLYARVDGRLSMSTDPAKLDQVWNAVASAWFDGGERDPDVELMRFDLAEGEIWATDGGAKFMYEIAKAHLTNSKPDVGDHATVRF